MRKEDLKILLVEDDANTRSTIRAMMAEMGVSQVFEGTDGKTAQEFVDSDAIDIDLVISDWNMPNKTGFEFLREIRTTHPRVPFIMVTARADENSVKDAMSAGVTAYIRKPFSLKELEEKIDAVVKKIR